MFFPTQFVWHVSLFVVFTEFFFATLGLSNMLGFIALLWVLAEECLMGTVYKGKRGISKIETDLLFFD